MFGAILNCVPGSVIRFASVHNSRVYQVVEIRDLQKRPVSKCATRKRPNVLRSRYAVKLIDKETGSLTTHYFVEAANVTIISHPADRSSDTHA